MDPITIITLGGMLVALSIICYFTYPGKVRSAPPVSPDLEVEEYEDIILPLSKSNVISHAHDPGFANTITAMETLEEKADIEVGRKRRTFNSPEEKLEAKRASSRKCYAKNREKYIQAVRERRGSPLIGTPVAPPRTEIPLEEKSVHNLRAKAYYDANRGEILRKAQEKYRKVQEASGKKPRMFTARHLGVSAAKDNKPAYHKAYYESSKAVGNNAATFNKSSDKGYSREFGYGQPTT